MRCIVILTLLLVVAFTSSAQESNISTNKGDFYIYWGWNKSAYTDSDIHFKGDNYDFTLSDVKAYDRQSNFQIDTYFHPSKFTIPQYNFRIGYYLTDRISISIGMDHMKYVVRQDQVVNINGYINVDQSIYNADYNNSNIALNHNFLQFEHTDGLNYINSGIRYHIPIYSVGIFDIVANTGVSAGILIPKTNTTLLEMQRHDNFHISGFGLDVLASVEFRFFDHYFIQSEWKGGFINMPTIHTSEFSKDRADQSFYFTEWNILFGIKF